MGLLSCFYFAKQFIFHNTHQSIEERPARVRATRREVADMWVMVKQAQDRLLYLRSGGLVLISAVMIAIGGLTSVRRNSWSIYRVENYLWAMSIEPIRRFFHKYTRQQLK
jgi:hypothetical protein